MSGAYPWVLAMFLAAALSLTYLAVEDRYAHSAPELDCSGPYDYAMCERASSPAPARSPSPAASYLGLLAAGLAALILAWWSYHSCALPRKQQGGDAWGHPLPESIPKNTVPPELVRRGGGP